jgi:putative lipoprotein
MQSGCVRRTIMKAAALVALAASLSAVSASAADASLLGTHWRLVSVGDQPANTSRREPFIVLTDGRIEGSTGCNTFDAGYRLEDAALSFSFFATTRMYCKEVFDQERLLLDTLPAVTGWTVNGNRLELKDSAGTVLAVYEAVPGAD